MISNKKNQVVYIYIIRFIAILLITNTHMNNIYPYEIIATGGLIGDCLFFFVSGYGLSIKPITLQFPKWYFNRFIRIYPIVWIATIFYIIIGEYQVTSGSVINTFLFPTEYHFVASIMIQYIFFYIIIKYLKKYKNIIYILVGVLAIIVYIVLFDKSFYHIDAVKGGFIQFLYFYSMALGICFEENDKKDKTNGNIIYFILLFMAVVFYGITKIGFMKNIFPSELQFINQISIFLLVFAFAKSVSFFKDKFNTMESRVIDVVIFISKISLEIYVVQKPIIHMCEKLDFPINFICSVILIIGAAFILNYIVKLLNILFNKLMKEGK